jgi:hypothetical protein
VPVLARVFLGTFPRVADRPLDVADLDPLQQPVGEPMMGRWLVARQPPR